MTQIKMVGCKVASDPIVIQIENDPKYIKLFLNEAADNSSLYEVMPIGKSLLLYVSEHARKYTFNRMFRKRPIYGNLLISRYDPFVGNRSNLSDDECIELMNELTKSSLINQTN